MIDAGIGANSASGGYDIDNSLKLEADNTEFMERVTSQSGNQKTWTYSGWIKRTEISYAGDGYGHTFFMAGAYGSEACLLRFNTGTTAATLDTLQIDIGFGGTLSRSHTSQVFRDTSAWYHIVLAVDTTQSTADDRFKLYVNGELVTSYYSRNNPTQNFDTSNNIASSSTYSTNVGAYKSGGTTYGKFSGYIAESYNIDGSALEPTAFGEFDSSGIWKPKKYTGSFPNNSWYLKFDDSGALGADSSGNSHTFTLNNITAADQATDTPTNNFCTYNSTMYMFGNTFITEGATKLAKLYQNWITPMPTIGVSRGKWYAEFEFVNTGIDSMIGVVPMGEPGFEGSGVTNSNAFLGQSTNSIGYYGQAGQKYINNSGSSYGNSYVAGDKMAVALDMDNGKVYFAKNGTWQNSGVPTSGATGTGAIDLIQPTETHGIASSIWNNNSACLSNYGGYTTISISSAASDENGYGTFEYAPPTGYYALCTKNLAEYG